MGYNRADVYYQPEQFGLTFFGSVEEEPNYDFNILQVWLHEDGTLYWAQDSGCSCPSPFEDYTSLAQLDKVADDWDAFDAAVNSYSCPDVDKVDLLRRCSPFVPAPDFSDLKEGLEKLLQP